jgi:hypothetical protein
MMRCKLLGLVGVMALGLTLGLRPGAAQDTKKGAAPHAMDHWSCAKVCGECAGMCDACAAHCAELLASGKKDHLKTLQFCQDCASVCAAAACITARHGPFSDTICTACADACKRCGAACEHFKDDDMMKRCADVCHKCEMACREMLKHGGKTGATTEK